MDGEYVSFQHGYMTFPILTLGHYVLFFKAEWTPLNTWRKLVMNIYAPDPIVIKRISSSKYPQSIFQMMEEWLNSRLMEGDYYDIPVMGGLEENEEEND